MIRDSMAPSLTRATAARNLDWDRKRDQVARGQFRDKAEAMRLYAKQANDIELETAAAEIKLRAQRRL